MDESMQIFLVATCLNITDYTYLLILLIPLIEYFGHTTLITHSCKCLGSLRDLTVFCCICHYRLDFHEKHKYCILCGIAYDDGPLAMGYEIIKFLLELVRSWS